VARPALAALGGNDQCGGSPAPQRWAEARPTKSAIKQPSDKEASLPDGRAALEEMTVAVATAADKLRTRQAEMQQMRESWQHDMRAAKKAEKAGRGTQARWRPRMFQGAPTRVPSGRLF
jgi:hypothetical protein